MVVIYKHVAGMMLQHYYQSYIFLQIWMHNGITCVYNKSQHSIVVLYSEHNDLHNIWLYIFYCFAFGTSVVAKCFKNNIKYTWWSNDACKILTDGARLWHAPTISYQHNYATFVDYSQAWKAINFIAKYDTFWI